MARRLLVSALLALGCQDAIGYEDPLAETDYEVHERTYADGKPHGVWRYYYANGELWRELELKHGVKDGAEHVYYPSGIKQQEGNWKQNLRDGRWVSYAEDGSRCAEAVMAAGTGTYRYCFGNGQLAQESEQLSGVLHGLTTEYFADGTLRASLTYDQGVLHGPFSESDGEVRLEGNYERGRLHGLVTGTYEGGGARASRGNYVMGVATGLHQSWYENGQLLESVVFDEQGRPDGVHERHYEDGQLEQRQTYADGLREGPFESYYSDGTAWVLGAYADDLQSGLWEFYGETGEPDSFVEFEAGENIGFFVDYRLGMLDSIKNFGFREADPTKTTVLGMSLALNGGELTQLCRFEESPSSSRTVGCLDLQAGPEGIAPQRLEGTWQLAARNGSPADSGESLQIQAGGTGTIRTGGLELPFTYELKGPLLLRSLGAVSELDAFFVDGDDLYLFRRENYWVYRRGV